MSQQPIPGTRSLSRTAAGHCRVPYLALHPMGFSVPPRLRLERWALTPPFHPYPALSGSVSFNFPEPNLNSASLSERAGRYVLCGTVRQDASRHHFPHLSREPVTGYAASRPLVFGLSSPGLHRERFSALPKSDPNISQKRRRARRRIK